MYYHGNADSTSLAVSVNRDQEQTWNGTDRPSADSRAVNLLARKQPLS